MLSIQNSLVVGILILSSLTACTRSHNIELQASIPHLDLEMTGAEYARLIGNQPRLLQGLSVDDDAIALKPALDFGKRNLDFLNFINQHRDAAHHISLTSKETQTGIPIEKPIEYNLAIVLKMYDDLLTGMPIQLKNVLLGTGAFPENPPMTDDDYIIWGRMADRVYQKGNRWLLMKPYLDALAFRKKSDLRGYYNLINDADLKTELSQWGQLDQNRRDLIRSWLIGSCFNGEELDICENNLTAAVTSAAELQTFASQIIEISRNLWNSYFVMQWDRSDIIWTAAHPEVLHVPFVDPKDPGVMKYLRDNIEDEWKWLGWNLRLDFQPGSESTMTHLRYEVGGTPRVEVPNTIVMDKNQPTTEYDSQWTIRHEFGHILGFPDCYMEFYDADKAAIVSYQLDITNLMCSRRGAFKETHFNELKRVYLH